MTQRLDTRFTKLKEEGRAALITFIMAYDPNRDASQDVLNQLPKAGADVIELGIPFSDPMADGPIIAKAGQRALKAGATLAGVLDMVRKFRQTDADTPIILMGYFNPIFRYGAEQFVTDAVAAGADGAIIVDLPLEELGELQPHADAHSFSLVRLLAPTTPDDRMEAILKGSRGFAYYIAVAGITGQLSADVDALEQRVGELKHIVNIPLAVGFGVKTPDQAAAIGQFADGVVVGSAIVDTLHTQGSGKALELVAELASGIRHHKS